MVTNANAFNTKLNIKLGSPFREFAFSIMSQVSAYYLVSHIVVRYIYKLVSLNQ